MALIVEKRCRSRGPGPIAGELDHGGLGPSGEVGLREQRRARSRPSASDRRQRRGTRRPGRRSRPSAAAQVGHGSRSRSCPTRLPWPIHLPLVVPAARDGAGIGRPIWPSPLDGRHEALKGLGVRHQQVATDRRREAGGRKVGETRHGLRCSTATSALDRARPASDEYRVSSALMTPSVSSSQERISSAGKACPAFM